MSIVQLGPATVDLEGVYAGEPNPLPMHVHHAGVPVDLTDFTIRAQVRPKLGDPEIALTGITDITDAENGDFTLSWDGDEIRDLMADAEPPTTSWSGVWDLELDNGTPETVVAGKFKAKMDVTQ